MATRTEIKFYSSLKQRKNRAESRLFIAEGRKIVEEGLKSSCGCIGLFVEAGAAAKNPALEALIADQPYETLSAAEFGQISDTEHPQGILGVFDYEALLIERAVGPRIVALFDVADPRNMGTIIRSSDWFGIHELMIGETCVDPFNPKVVRSTMGSVFHNRFVFAPDLIAALKSYKSGYSLIAADMDGQDYRGFPYGERSILIFSNEARGPSEGILALTDGIVTIPGSGQAESLNVACAATVIMSRL